MKRKEYLDNGIVVYQDDDLYKFTSDSVLLTRFATVKKGDVVADFCSGSGIVGFNLFALNRDLIESVAFFEMQTPLFDLANESILLNGLEEKFSSVNTKVQDIGSNYAGKFSLIVCNPPYMPVGHGFYEKDDNVAVCRTELTLSLSELIFAIGKCLKFGGRTAICHRADRLVDVIYEMKKNNIEPKRLQFVTAGKKEPYLLLIEGVKGGKSGIKVQNSISN